VIIPSYNENNQLNTFVGRTYEDAYHKYRGPESSKDIIVFENLINWAQPIILVEGVFDAIAVKRNAVPILGKSISKSLIKKIVSSTVEDIYIALDRDALKKALQYVEQFLNMGKKVYLVDMQDKDPSEMGFVNFTHHVQQAEEMDLGKLLRYKLS
jgi:DNA primase